MEPLDSNVEFLEKYAQLNERVKNLARKLYDDVFCALNTDGGQQPERRQESSQGQDQGVPAGF